MLVFISYRRDDSAGHAGRLSEDLIRRFGPDNVFLDLDEIGPGHDFSTVISDAIARAVAMVVLIGPRWLTATTAAGDRRLDNPQDLVRREVATALGRDLLVVPVLLQRATMPSAHQLPEELKPLAARNAIELRDAAWRDDVERLAAALDHASRTDDWHRVDSESARTNIDAVRLPIVGRERELAELAALVDSESVVTILGAPGTGKTRLATQVGLEALPRFSGGVWMVSLAALAPDSSLLAWTGAGLGVQAGAIDDLERRIARRLDRGPTLLILDNFEHVLDQAPVIEGLVRACPGLHVLATSQFPLPLDGRGGAIMARRYSLGALDAAIASGKQGPNASVRLFCSLVHEASGADPCLDQLPVVADICRDLDGLPLAIELAAARSRAIGLVSMRALLQDHLFSVTDDRDTGGRSSLKGAIGWTCSFLSPEEERLFRIATAFRGGFSFDAISSVWQACGGDAGVLIDGLVGLVDSNLMSTRHDGGIDRYDMLEPIRLFGLERLNASTDASAVRTAHAAWCLAEAKRLDHLLGGTDSARVAGQFEAERANMRAALAWLRASGAREHELELAIALSWFWTLRGDLTEGRERLAAALEDPPVGRADQRAMAMNRQAGLARMQGAYDEATELYKGALVLSDESPFNEGFALNGLGRIAASLGDVEAARSFLGKAEAVRRAMLRRDRARKPSLAVTLDNLGDLDLDVGNRGRARDSYAESHRLRHEHGDLPGIAISHLKLGRLARVSGRTTLARAWLLDALRRFSELGYRDWIAAALDEFAAVAHAIGDDALAVYFWGAADGLHDILGTVRSQREEDTDEAMKSPARMALGRAAFQRELRRGRDEAVGTVVASLLAGAVGGDDQG